jgi:hypothetical protein
MTKGVVDDFESVEIQEHHSQTPFIPLRLCDREAQTVLEQRAIG